MALVLIRNLDGKGNVDSATERLMPAARKPSGGWGRTGGEAWRPEIGAGSTLTFRPWEAVRCPSGRPQEEEILSHVRQIWGNDAPVVRLDFTGRENRDVMREYLRRHPELAPTAEPGTSDYVLEMMALVSDFEAGAGASDGVVRRPAHIMDADAAPATLLAQAEAIKAAAGAPASGGRRLGEGDAASVIARGAQTAQAAQARIDEHAAAVYDKEYARHRAKGHPEGRAAEYAERSRKTALKQGAQGTQGTQEAGA